MTAAKRIILFLWLVLVGVTHAPAAVLHASENRTWEKIGAPSQTRLAEPAQVAGSHQEKTALGSKTAVGCCLAAKGATAETSAWTRTVFNDTRVYQRSDLIDAALVDARGRTNLQRMQSGIAPIGSDGKSINLHHMLQSNDSPLAEMTTTFHQQNSAVIHINPNTIPSGIDRKAFDAFRRDYWMNRANDFAP